MVVDHDSLNFLDVTIFQGPGDSMHTKLFRKQTMCNAFLHANTSHPPHCIHGIPKGRYLRIRRKCTIDSDFKAEAAK